MPAPRWRCVLTTIQERGQLCSDEPLLIRALIYIGKRRDIVSQQQVTTGLERMLSMKDVRDILGVSYGVIYGLIREGKLKAVRVTGEPISRYTVNDSVLGLRFRPSDVRQFLQQQLIK